MDTLIKNLANLIKVKTVVTFVVLAVYAALAIRGDVTPDKVELLTMGVITFYFGTQHEKSK